MPLNLAQKLIESHLLGGRMKVGEEISLRVDQAFTPDPSGVLVHLELEAMGVGAVRPPLAVTYADHNLLQADQLNAEDHLFLSSSCAQRGMWFSPPGNGISHAVHAQRFGAPGLTVVACDSHTPAAGSLGMLGVGVGGLDVAMVLAGEPLRIRMPQVWGVELLGALPPWVSAKDVILEMLRRHRVSGGAGRIIEYYGPGVETLSVMDRHVIANMGTELGALSTVFPADSEVHRYLELERRGDSYREIKPDEGATYDVHETIDLARLEPLVAKPSSPDNVVPVHEIAGLDIHQAYIGSSANAGLRDLAVPALIVAGHRTKHGVSFDINPASRQTLENLAAMQLVQPLLHAGARLHQAGCNGCIGMGQAPAVGRPSLRTTPRNFPGRSGTREDAVFLVSPETATASALTGQVTDPRDLPDLLGIDHPHYADPGPEEYIVNDHVLTEPPSHSTVRGTGVVRGSSIVALPDFDSLPDGIEVPVLLKLGDNISTDEILAGGPHLMGLRGNIPASAAYTFEGVDDSYASRAEDTRPHGGHAIVGGLNYGQGSSREHAALTPRYLGLRVVLARSFGRIHWQNLVNFGVLPLEFVRQADYENIVQGDQLELTRIGDALRAGAEVSVSNKTREENYLLRHSLSARQVEIVTAGGLLPFTKARRQNLAS